MTCSHPDDRLQAFTTNHGRHGLRCLDCGMTAIEGDGVLRTLLKDVIRRLRRKP